jgi:hypothetical protein
MAITNALIALLLRSVGGATQEFFRPITDPAAVFGKRRPIQDRRIAEEGGGVSALRTTTHERRGGRIVGGQTDLPESRERLFSMPDRTFVGRQQANPSGSDAEKATGGATERAEVFDSAGETTSRLRDIEGRATGNFFSEPSGRASDIHRSPESIESFLDSEDPGFQLGLLGFVSARALLDRLGLSEEKRADLLTKLSIHLRRGKDSRGALTSIREAVDLRRSLAASNPHSFAPHLAVSLRNFSECLTEVGDEAESLEAIREAVRLYRPLAEANPRHFAHELASALSALASRLGGTGESESALRVSREAISIYRSLVQELPERYLPDLAVNLVNLSDYLCEVGDDEAMLAASREAANTYRKVSLSNPGRFAPYLARSLLSLSNCLSDAADIDEAVLASREAIEILRPFAQTQPDRFCIDLATGLDNLSIQLSEAGDIAGALRASREGCHLFRELAKAEPDLFAADLAHSLNNLSNRLLDIGSMTESLSISGEAVEIFRQLAQKLQEQRYFVDLAVSLSNHSRQQALAGNKREALNAGQEAAELRGSVASSNPGIQGLSLERSLDIFARMQKIDRGVARRRGAERPAHGTA